jgi:spermidine synthase
LVLLISIFVVASCGLIYELIAGTLSTYLLGNSVTQFSLVIGMFLSAMGLGSFLSRFVQQRLLTTFLVIEIVIGFVGGNSALILFFSFAILDTYLLLLIVLSMLIGTLVGLEIPLLVRIVRTYSSLPQALGNVLAIDYLGALFASLLFPLLLLPWLGLVRTCFFFGLMNTLVAWIGLVVFKKHLRKTTSLKLSVFLSSLLLVAGLLSAGQTTTWMEDALYEDEILFAKTTPYQRLVLTRWHDDIRLFIDGNIQFSSVDEFRYHESLVHPAMGHHPGAQSVLILGGGDGMVAREVLKYASVKRIHLVDLDPAMTRIFSSLPMLTALNNSALKDPRVSVFNQDAQKFLENSRDRYDIILLDLPDPNNESLGKLYTRSFYRLAAKHLTHTGIMTTQATSPFYAPDAFWCIVQTMEAVDLTGGQGRLFVRPYHANVPSFGEWGFVMASWQPIAMDKMHVSVATRFLTDASLPGLFAFPKDMQKRPTPVNRLDNQVLTRLYSQGYARFNQ